jgi:GNAT superfamily N-acetyltransferase
MRIRQMTVGDTDRCLRLDTSYRTNYVWHLVENTAENRIEVILERTRLPRHIEVVYPCAPADLAEECRTGDCILVADHLTQIQGWVNVRKRHWNNSGWVEFCAVDRACRSQGVGAQMLTAAEEWARSARLRQLVLPMQTKNDQAIHSAVKRGYRFSGYLDRYFDNEDIGLLFAKSL